MSECKKCGYKVKEDMSFCPRCGAPLKAEDQPIEQRPTARTRYRGEKAEKGEKREKEEKGEKHEKEEKHEKGEHAFIGPFIGGLVLIIIGLISFLQVTGVISTFAREVVWASVIIIIGVLVIFGAVYAMIITRRRNPAV
jgi:cation transport ATPase